MDFHPEIRQSASFVASLSPSFEQARSAASRMDVPTCLGIGGAGMLQPIGAPDGGISPGTVRSVASARVNAEFGSELLSSEQLRRRDTIAESVHPQRQGNDGDVNVAGKRKCSRAWEMGRRVARKMSLPFRRRKSSAPKTPAGAVISGVRVDVEGVSEEATPLLASPAAEEIGYAVDLRDDEGRDVDQADEYDGILNAYPSSPPPRYRSSTPNSLSPLSRSESIHSRSSPHWLSSPHPENTTDGSYIDASTARVWERHQGMVFDEDNISFRFAGASGNQDDGASSLFYPGSEIGDASSFVGERSGRRGSQEALLEEIRVYGPSWGRGYRLEAIGEERSRSGLCRD